MRKAAAPYTVYILECADGSLYAGITTDLERRLKQHRKGEASKYTRSRLPVKCVYRQSQPSESHAKRRECQIKSLPRALKKELLKPTS